MSNEVAALEAEIKEYKLQVSTPSFHILHHSADSHNSDSLRPFNPVYKPTRTMQICKDSRQSLKKSFPSPKVRSQS